MRGVGGQFVIKKYGTGEGDISAVQSHKSAVFEPHNYCILCTESGLVQVPKKVSICEVPFYFMEVLAAIYPLNTGKKKI